MKLYEAKLQFIQTWGVLGTQWGINRTMAQVHALLLISPESLSAEEIMEQLQISRGNANMNIRDLMNWNLVYKDLKPGERKEFFKAEKDMWEVAIRIIKERKRREIEPLLSDLKGLEKIEGNKNDEDIKAFTDTVINIEKIVSKLNAVTDTFIKADEHKVFGALLKIFK
jgi:DNA-binding transcriptional regulator GbsR (MarR family)